MTAIVRNYLKPILKLYVTSGQGWNTIIIMIKDCSPVEGNT